MAERKSGLKVCETAAVQLGVPEISKIFHIHSQKKYRWSKSNYDLIIEKMPGETTVRCFINPTLMVTIGRQKTRVSENVETLVLCRWNCHMIYPLWKTVRQFLRVTVNRVIMWPSHCTSEHVTHRPESLKEMCVHPHFQHCCSQQLELGSNLGIHWWMSEQEKWGLSVQWEWEGNLDRCYIINEPSGLINAKCCKPDIKEQTG